MMHLEDGTLQGFLDDELSAGERAETAEHLLSCAECHRSYEELMQANALFAQSVSVLDVEPPATSPAVVRSLRGRARSGTLSFVKAAGLVLGFAAVASAAVPGSPVRDWIARVAQPAPLDEVESTESPIATPEPGPVPAPTPAGVSIAPANDGAVEVTLTGLEDVVIRLETIAGPRASVSVVGADRDPTFRTGAGTVEVLDAVGGAVYVRLPRDVEGARLFVDGRLYAGVGGGTLRIHVPADTTGGHIIWR